MHFKGLFLILKFLWPKTKRVEFVLNTRARPNIKRTQIRKWLKWGK